MFAFVVVKRKIISGVIFDVESESEIKISLSRENFEIFEVMCSKNGVLRYFWGNVHGARNFFFLNCPNTLREILLVVLTKRSQLYSFSKQYQKFCKCYYFFFVKLIKFIYFEKRKYFISICNISCVNMTCNSLVIVNFKKLLYRRIIFYLLINCFESFWNRYIYWFLKILLLFFIKMRRIKLW